MEALFQEAVVQMPFFVHIESCDFDPRYEYTQTK